MKRKSKIALILIITLLALYIAPRRLVALGENQCVYAYNQSGDEAQGTSALVLGNSALVWGRGFGVVRDFRNVRVGECLPRLLDNNDLVYDKREVIP